MSDDFIDEFDQQQKNKQSAKDHKWQVFPAKANRTWDALKARILQLVAKMNTTASTLAAMHGKIEINTRELTPHEDELDIDKINFPAIRLTVVKSVHAEIIKIDQSRKEAPEGQYKETSEVLHLKFEDNDEVNIYKSDGTLLNVDQAARFILERFLS